MFRKQLAAALAVLLAVCAGAPCARAQSGRRFPRAGGDKGFVTLTVERSDWASAPVKEVRERRAGEFDLRGLNAGRSTPVVYAAGGDGRASTKAKIAVAALVGYLIFAIAVTATSDGYAPQGRSTPGAGLRR
jgi:hypothetical protein